MNRRTFLKIVSIGSVSTLAGCMSQTEKNLFSLVHAPDGMVVGEATWYASTCRECPAGCGILAKNREGRVVKVEGSPFHPINKGKLCMRGQSTLQGIYNPDRLKTPLIRRKDGWQPLSFSSALDILKTRAHEAAEKGPGRVRMLTETVGDSLMSLFTTVLANLNSRPPLIYEPFAYESLKTANQKIFAVNGLNSYRMDQADLLVSFGADFLETWLSPVEYACKFKSMHALRDGRKKLFFEISPILSLTGANADHWLACKPRSEAAIALGLVRKALDKGKGDRLCQELHELLENVTASYSQDHVLQRSGISSAEYENLVARLTEAKKPLVLGTGTGACDLNALQTNMAVNLLNLLLYPELGLHDFDNRHRVEMAATHAEIMNFFQALTSGEADLLLLNNVNPVFTLPQDSAVKKAIENRNLFVVSFNNFMDETSQLADLILPFQMPLETWDEYGGKHLLVSTLQPAMGKVKKIPSLGDMLLLTGFRNDKPAKNYKDWLVRRLLEEQYMTDEVQWVHMLQQGGKFDFSAKVDRMTKVQMPNDLSDIFTKTVAPVESDLVFVAAPSIRFFDGRGSNKSWLCEIPDPLTMVAWQTPIIIHPETAKQGAFAQGDIIQVQSKSGELQAPVYLSEHVNAGVLVMGIGQGHSAYGRYAKNTGINPFKLISSNPDPISGGRNYSADLVSIKKTGKSMKLAHTDGSRTQHGRKIALTVSIADATISHAQSNSHHGLGMDEFPFTLPLPSGYDPGRDFYPPHDHDGYRWSMVVDLDRCIGCSACASACYAENNVGVVGEKFMLEGREMAWLQVQRYVDSEQRANMTFLPMLCQHCDNAPCESVCPVFAPHHSKEGINNQIYNRCIGTRFCSQNCPYKVRRFNWFDWKWPAPLNLQLNPDVTVRSKGVMEKCSFCIQRIKTARNIAKNENRLIRDGEVTPACVQTCPTDALVFGNLMDKESRVRKMVRDPRAYQVMGYLNTKPAVIYLKKVVTDI